MALADTGRAIGAVTRHLVQQLTTATGLSVNVGRPEQGRSAGQRFNLFLYEIEFDPHLKNHALDEGLPPPLWLVLKYLITAFDSGGDSDTAEALDFLGAGLRALQQASIMSFANLTLPVDPDLLPLVDNPEPLHLTFDEATADMLSKIMQGTDEQYRMSAAFQVRPVMIATGEPPSYSLLVGVDYTAAPPAVIGEQGVQNAVLPSLGPVLDRVEPATFEPGDEITLHGSDLHLAGLRVQLGPVELPVIAQRADELRCRLDPAAVDPAVISAGSHPLAVVQPLPFGRSRSSNLLIAHLRPILDTVTLVPPVSPSTVPPVGVYADFDIQGRLLGLDRDDTYAALYRNGAVVRMLDTLVAAPGSPPPQTLRRVSMHAADAVPPGDYLVLIRVNGVQARSALPLSLTP